jgi:penicillin-insensitive murein endopeptidase
VGFLTTQRARHRFFGHPELVGFLEDLGTAVDRHTGKRMVVGDLSQPRGGPMPNGHRSHQSVIDADVWLWLAPPQRSEPDEAPSMVLEGEDQVDPQRWGSDQVWLAKEVASHPAVDRIFVNAAIKAALCNEAGTDRRWLQKIRPWWHHRAHLHVRLRCPPGSPDCIAQPALPAGEGCGSELAWWFTDEAKAPRPPAKTPAEKPLPKECRALLSENRRR